jgi:hypothetical protein
MSLAIEFELLFIRTDRLRIPAKNSAVPFLKASGVKGKDAKGWMQ